MRDTTKACNCQSIGPVSSLVSCKRTEVMKHWGQVQAGLFAIGVIHIKTFLWFEPLNSRTYPNRLVSFLTKCLTWQKQTRGVITNHLEALSGLVSALRPSMRKKKKTRTKWKQSAKLKNVSVRRSEHNWHCEEDKEKGSAVRVEHSDALSALKETSRRKGRDFAWEFLQPLHEEKYVGMPDKS